MTQCEQRDSARATNADESVGGWMAAFTYQYERFRRRCPDKPLLVVFDIDGTIVDSRYAALRAMRLFDRQHDTSIFSELDVEDIHSGEGQVQWANRPHLLAPADEVRFRQWYDRWSTESEVILASHEPYRGVLDFMRWLQLQPAVHIALNTSRLDVQRHDTMHVLDVLGRAFGVRFRPHLIQMRPGREASVQSAKIAGLRRFRRDGFQVIAVADSQRENIAAIHRFSGFWDETLYLESLAPREIKQAKIRDEMQSDKDDNEPKLQHQVALCPTNKFVSQVV